MWVEVTITKWLPQPKILDENSSLDNSNLLTQEDADLLL
jgi:hypothetical protein